MKTKVKVGVKVDTTGIETAIDAIDRLRFAVQRASSALDELSGKDHGGICIRAIGDLVHIEVKPVEVRS